MPHSASSGGLPKTYASPYDHEDTATLEGAIGGPLRSSGTESELMTYHGRSSASSQKHLLRSHSLGRPSGDSPYEDMKHSPQLQLSSTYENTSRQSYPSSGGGISLSPADMMLGGFVNPAFIASPQQSLSKSPWYQEIRASYGREYMPPSSQIMHTYLDPQLAMSGGATAASHYASPPTKPQLKVVLPQAEGGSSLKRSSSLDNLFGRMSFASSVGSPLLDTLDLAHSTIYTSPRLSVGLPKTPSHTGLPPELNTYIGTPHQQMFMVEFPQAPNYPPIEENPQYEKMAQQEAQQSFNNNNQGMSIPIGEQYIYMHRHSAQPGLSAPLAAAMAGLVPAGNTSSIGRMKRSHSEADLLDCKKMNESGYMTMHNQTMAAAYMDMEKGYLAKLKAAAQEAAARQNQGNALKPDRETNQASSETSPYMTPRNVLKRPEQIMTEQEMDQTIDTFATARRKKSGTKISQFFGHSPTENDDAKSGSGSPQQSPRKYNKSPSQALIGRMKRTPKKKKDKQMKRSCSEPDLANIGNEGNTGYMDMRKSHGSIGSKSQMKRTNSDFDLDDNVSVGSGDSVPSSEPGDRIVYTYRKRFQGKDAVGIEHVPIPVPSTKLQEPNGKAVKPASHTVPANISTSPVKKKFQLKMFRQSKSKNVQSPAVSSTGSSPDLQRSSNMAQSSPSPRPKLSKLKIPRKSLSSDAGIVPTESHKSFGKQRSMDKPDESESKSTFYLSHDHELVSELSNRPLPSLPRGVKPPGPSEPHFAQFPRAKPPSPARPIPVPIPHVPPSYKASHDGTGDTLRASLSSKPEPIPTEDELEAAEAAAAAAGTTGSYVPQEQRSSRSSSLV